MAEITNGTGDQRSEQVLDLVVGQADQPGRGGIDLANNSIQGPVQGRRAVRGGDPACVVRSSPGPPTCRCNLSAILPFL
jgi:hypothetical protein